MIKVNVFGTNAKTRKIKCIGSASTIRGVKKHLKTSGFVEFSIVGPADALTAIGCVERYDARDVLRWQSSFEAKIVCGPHFD